MHKLAKSLLLLAITTLSVACMSTPTKQPFVDRSYQIGQVYSISQGQDIFATRTGLSCRESYWVGLYFGGMTVDTWEEDVIENQL
ncbi:MAG: hypothetical protein ACI9HE_003200, partial [Planctomycetota bacterium]